MYSKSLESIKSIRDLFVLYTIPHILRKERIDFFNTLYYVRIRYKHDLGSKARLERIGSKIQREPQETYQWKENIGS